MHECLFPANLTTLRESIARLVERHTCNLSLVETTLLGKSPDTDLQVQRKQYMSILRAASSHRLERLSVCFASEYDAEQYAELTATISRQGPACRHLILRRCSTSIFTNFVVNMGRHLRFLECSFDFLDSLQHASPFEIRSYMLPNLSEIELFGSDEYAEVLAHLLQELGPQLRSLFLSSSSSLIPRPSWGSSISMSWDFPILNCLDCGGVPDAVLTAIIAASPELSVLCIDDMQHFQGSLLDVVPARIEELLIGNLTTWQDPFETLLGKLSRLTSLKQVPHLYYRLSDRSEVNSLWATNEALREHFKGRDQDSKFPEYFGVLDYDTDY